MQVSDEVINIYIFTVLYGVLYKRDIITGPSLYLQIKSED